MVIKTVELPNGKDPVKEFLEKEIKDNKMLKKIIRLFEIAEKYGLKMLNSGSDFKKLSGYNKYNLWEFRIKFNTNICRIFFTLRGETCYLLHGFIKKSQATPQREIDLAIDRIKYIS